MPSIAENSLDAVLNAWEDYSLLREVHMRVIGSILPMVPEVLPRVSRWRSYRSTLLDNRIEKLDLMDWQVELIPQLQKLFHWGGLSALNTFPLEYFAWTRKSRRVFSLPPAEQDIFSQALFPEMRWGEILWPFESFSVELASPVKIPLKGFEYFADEILVSRVWIGEMYLILARALSSKVEPLFDLRERRSINKALQSGRFRQAGELIDRTVRRHSQGWRAPGSLGICLFNSGLDNENNLIPWGEDRENEVEQAQTVLARVVLGTCLYLDSISQTKSQEWTKRQKPGQRYIGPLGIITDEADVCVIKIQGLIDPAHHENESDFVINKSGFVRPHWRRRHRKRPRGTETNHPKTIIVPPKLINAALVPFFGILPGSITRMLSYENKEEEQRE